MAFRDDITIDWSQSPRIIETTSSSDEITIQDLYDTLRTLAAYPEALDDDEIVDAGGLEAGIVGLTMTLKNALLKFKNTGSPRVCKVSGGNIFAVDAIGDYMCPIVYNTNVTVAYAQSTSATLLETGISGLTEEESLQLSKVDDIYDEAFGKWVLNPTAKTLTLYKSAGGILKVFNLTETSETMPAFIERVPA